MFFPCYSRYLNFLSALSEIEFFIALGRRFDVFSHMLRLSRLFVVVTRFNSKEEKKISNVVHLKKNIARS